MPKSRIRFHANGKVLMGRIRPLNVPVVIPQCWVVSPVSVHIPRFVYDW